MFRSRIVSLTGLCFGLIIFAACAGAAVPPVLIAPVSADIRMDTAVVTRGPVAEVWRHSGVVRRDAQPLNFGSLAAAFGEYYVRLGEDVIQGQLLARLDFEELEKQIARQEERISDMNIAFVFDNELRTLDLDIRAIELTNDALYVSHEVHERRMLELDRAWVELELAGDRHALTMSHEAAVLQSLRDQLTQSEMRAPFSGTVVHLAPKAPGAWVAPFEPMVYIARTDAPVYVEYIQDSGNMPHLRHRHHPNHPSRAVRVMIHADGQVFETTRVQLTRDQILRYGNPAPVRFSIVGDTQPALGSFAAIHAYSHWVEDVLRIPRSALLSSPDLGFYTYRIENGQRIMTMISVGPRTETYVAVLSGLEEGDEVYVRP